AAARARVAGARGRDGSCRCPARARALMAARDFRDAGHLPNLREGKPPADPDELPRQRNGVTPQMHGRYPDFNVLDEADHWDEVTRRVVLERVEPVPEIRYFTTPEAITLGAFLNAVLAQD